MYKCPVLPSQQTTMAAVDAVVECIGLEDDEEMRTVRYFLDRIADLIDPGEGMDEDGREALDWVREHGGVEHVKEQGETLARRLSALAREAVADADPEDEAEPLDVLERAVSCRLMPEGMEWPRFDDLEPVRIGDDFMDMHGRTHTVYAVKLKEGDRFTLIGTDCCGQTFPAGSRVGRPGAAPKVLDADGVEIRVGDTVWYANGDGLQLTVVRIESDRVVTTNARDGEQWWAAYILTHERPESWERIEGDTERGKTYTDESVLEFVRRARALAERGQ